MLLVCWVYLHNRHDCSSGGAADKNGTLKVGDEIISVNSTDCTRMSRIEAWNFMKKLNDGTASLVVRHKITETSSGAAPSASAAAANAAAAPATTTTRPKTASAAAPAGSGPAATAASAEHTCEKLEAKR